MEFVIISNLTTLMFYFIILGAEINQAGPSGHFPLSESSSVGLERMTFTLLQNNADLEKECTAHKNATPLTIAALMDRPRVVEMLLKVSILCMRPMIKPRCRIGVISLISLANKTCHSRLQCLQ